MCSTIACFRFSFVAFGTSKFARKKKVFINMCCFQVTGHADTKDVLTQISVQAAVGRTQVATWTECRNINILIFAVKKTGKPKLLYVVEAWSNKVWIAVNKTWTPKLLYVVEAWSSKVWIPWGKREQLSFSLGWSLFRGDLKAFPQCYLMDAGASF